MPSKIRILHCIETIASGGVEQTLLTIVKGLDKSKFVHKIICTWKGGPVAEVLEKEGVEIFAVGSYNHPFQWRKHLKVLKLIRAYKPQIIHGAVFEGMTMASIGGFLGKVPVIILEETSDPQNRSLKANFLLRLFSKRADAFQAISNEVGDYLKIKTKVHPKLIKIIPNGVSIPNILSLEERNDFKSLLSIRKSDFVIGFVGRLFNGHKRFTDLVEAISLINAPNLKLLLIGDGVDKELLQTEVDRLNISKNLIYVGYQSNPHPYYDIMDVLCVPSSREGFGLVAAEAMMHKLPVIGSKVGGLQNVILNEVTGLLFTPFSPKEIAQRIQTLYNNPVLRKNMGEKGYARALEFYSSYRYVREVEILYLDLLKSKNIID